MTKVQKPIVLLTIAVVWFVTILLVQFSLIPEFSELTGQNLLDLGGYTPAGINDVIAAYGTEGIALYGQIQIADMIAPLALGLLLTGLCLRLTRLISGDSWRLGYFPLLIVVFDYTENVMVFLALRSFPDPVSLAYAETLQTVTSIKNAAYFGSAALIVLVAATYVVVSARRRLAR